MGVFSTANVLRGLLPWRCLLSLHFVLHHAVHPKQDMILPSGIMSNRRCGRCVTSHRVGVDQLVDIKYFKHMCSAVSLSKTIAREVVIGCKEDSKALPENYNDIDLVQTAFLT